jgi:hypothetical protein
MYIHISNADFGNFLWDDYNQDENDLLCLLGDQTPMKECMDFENIPFCNRGNIFFISYFEQNIAGTKCTVLTFYMKIW